MAETIVTPPPDGKGRRHMAKAKAKEKDPEPHEWRIANPRATCPKHQTLENVKRNLRAAGLDV